MTNWRQNIYYSSFIPLGNFKTPHIRRAQVAMATCHYSTHTAIATCHGNLQSSHTYSACRHEKKDFQSMLAVRHNKPQQSGILLDSCYLNFLLAFCLGTQKLQWRIKPLRYKAFLGRKENCKTSAISYSSLYQD